MPMPKLVAAPGSSHWSRYDYVEDLKTQVERWQARATALNNDIECACAALRDGQDVVLSDSKGQVVVTRKERD